MAQIGSPPAGWYTDPSGQHRARFWDGAAWTEQVRDDLTDQTGAPAAIGPTPQVPANPAAQTVAGVAEAVAAVATSDVIQPAGGGPPLIVDYGTDYAPWVSGNGSNGSNGVTDPTAPTASTAPSIDPFADPAFFVTADASYAATASELGLSRDPALAPMTAAAVVETPSFAVAPAAAPTGPTPGWYPDPAARHQARWWDGTQWTEQIADNGVEGLDPLPGMPMVAAMVTHDPTVGTWSEQLLDPTGPGGVLSDGTHASAGQASLASLPRGDDDEAGSRGGRVRPTAKVRIAGGMVLGGAVAMLLGSGMAWMQVRGPKVGAVSTSTGVDLGDGRITLALAIALAVFGAAIMTGRLAKLGGARVAAMGALVAGVAAVAVTAVDIADVADQAARLGVPPGAVTSVGTGLWLCFMGGVVAIGGGLMAFANRK